MINSLSPTSGVSPSSHPKIRVRRQSATLKAIDAFKSAITVKENGEVQKKEMSAAKSRWHKSVKRVMLQNAVENVKHFLGRPSSLDPEVSAGARSNSRGPSLSPDTMASSDRKSTGSP